MNNIKLYVPKLEDYWYEQKLLSDPDTMSYNSGYDVSYDGYNYKTGCIDFPESKWEINLKFPFYIFRNYHKALIYHFF